MTDALVSRAGLERLPLPTCWGHHCNRQDTIDVRIHSKEGDNKCTNEGCWD